MNNEIVYKDSKYVDSEIVSVHVVCSGEQHYSVQGMVNGIIRNEYTKPFECEYEAIEYADTLLDQININSNPDYYI